MRQYVESGTNVVLAVCAIVAVGLLLKREIVGQPAPPTSSRAPQYVDNWREIAGQGMLIGDSSAPLTVVKFSDFQCPACRQLAGTLRELRQKYPGAVSIRYVHFPLPYHPAARAAARASECAAAEGLFEAYHNLLFEKQDSIGRIPWDSLAIRAGVKNIASFDRCVRDTTSMKSVENGIRFGKSVGLRGTPTVLLNGSRFDGTVSPQILDSAVKANLGASTKK